jgi:hypothetical protein
MSQKAKGVFAVVAVSLTFGAVQLAFGHDLTSRFKSFAGASQNTQSDNAQTVGLAANEAVNRGAKADRLASGAAPSAATQTITFHVDRLPETSIVVRIPARNESSAAPAAVQLKDEHKATIACEPVVSVLTEIAKRLQPGRCVT